MINTKDFIMLLDLIDVKCPKNKEPNKKEMKKLEEDLNANYFNVNKIMYAYAKGFIKGFYNCKRKQINKLNKLKIK